MAKDRRQAHDGTLNSRLMFSEDIFREHLRGGMAFKLFIRGKPPVPDDGGDDEVEDVETLHFVNWRMVSYCAHGELRSLLLPSLLGEIGTWENVDDQLPPNATPEMKAAAMLRRQKARMWERLSRAIYREFRIHRHKRMSIDDALQFGYGAFETVKDTARRLCGFQFVSAKRVRFDCETEHDPMGMSRQWDAISYTMPLATAKQMAKDVWNAPKHEFETRALKDQDGEVSADFLATGGENELAQVVRVLYVFVRGADPLLNNADMGSEEAQRGKDPVYDGKDHVLVVEQVEAPDGKPQFKEVGRMEPELPNDIGQSPLTLVMLDPDNEEPLPPGIYQPAHSMQMALNWSLRYMNTDAWLSSMRIIMFLESLGVDEESMKAVLENPANLKTLAIKNPQAFDSIKSIDLGQFNPQLATVFNINQQGYGQLSNRDVFTGLATTGRETATRAALSSERAQLVMRGMMQQVDDALIEAMRKALMACRATMTAEDVAYWIGDEYMYFEEDLATGERVSPLWTDNPSLEEIRREVDINLRPMSTRWVNPEQRLIDMDRISKVMDTLASRVVMANQVNPALAMDFARAGNAHLREYGHVLGLPHADEITIDLTAASTPPLPPPQTGGPQGGGAGSPPSDRSPGANALANIQDQLGLQTTPGGELGTEVAAARAGGNGEPF